MSQEQPPIRSRRELRKARDAQQATPAATEQRPPAANRPAGGAQDAARPQDAARQEPAVQESSAQERADRHASSGDGGAAQPQALPVQDAPQRSSQIRARDRAALRTIKELEEKEGQLSAGGPPTRRQLRLQQLKEQALTAANPVVPAAGPTPPPAGGPSTQAARKAPAAGEAAPASAGAPNQAPDGMTVEQALEARALIAAQARNQIAAMEETASQDPDVVDPAILAEQIALAERAAVMNRRAKARQKLAEQAGGTAQTTAHATVPAPPATDTDGQEKAGPSTASNLAMVTPLEFVQVPGVERPVMKPPATSHVPVTTRPGSKVPSSGKRRPAARTKPAPAKQAPADPSTGRSGVIARAEAAAKAARRPAPVAPAEGQSGDLFEDLPRVPARSAYGLDPLDAATAGLTRARRNRVLQFCILAFGILALVAGIILIVTGMSR